MTNNSNIQKLQQILDESDEKVVAHLKTLDDSGLDEYRYKLVENYNKAVKRDSLQTIEALEPIVKATNAYIELKSLSTGETDAGFILG